MEVEKTLAAFAFTSLIKEEYVKSCEVGIGVLNRSDFISESERDESEFRANNENQQTIEKTLHNNVVLASESVAATFNSKDEAGPVSPRNTK